MLRRPKKGVVYVLHYPDENLYKVGCSGSPEGVKNRLYYWNRKLKLKGYMYAILHVSDKYKEERLFIWYLFGTNRCLYQESVELFLDVKKEIDDYIDNHLFT